MQEKGNDYGRVVEKPSPKVPAKSNANPELYSDGVGKQTPTPSCVLKDGKTPRYAKDGLTQDFDPSTPHVTPVR